MATNAATLRLMSDLRAIKQDPPQGCSASPSSEDNLFVWTATGLGELASLPQACGNITSTAAIIAAIAYMLCRSLGVPQSKTRR